MPLNENEKSEFKEFFDHVDFEAEVVSFLNEEGGTIYIGATNNGAGKGVADIGKTMLLISDSPARSHRARLLRVYFDP